MDLRFLNVGQELLRNEEIVDTPANIPFARMGEIIPIRISFALARMEVAKGIHVPILDHFVEPLAFDRKEAGVLLVLLWTRQIDWIVRRIHVSAEHHWLALTESLAEGQEGLIVTELELKPLRTPTAIGEVDVQ